MDAQAAEVEFDASDFMIAEERNDRVDDRAWSHWMLACTSTVLE